MISKELLEEIRESLSIMISYVEDELLDKYDENDEIYEDTEKANNILDIIYQISQLDNYSYIENKQVNEIIRRNKERE